MGNWGTGLVGAWPVVATKSVPVIDGDIIYAVAADVQGDSEKQEELPTFTELLAKYDGITTTS